MKATCTVSQSMYVAIRSLLLLEALCNTETGKSVAAPACDYISQYQCSRFIYASSQGCVKWRINWSMNFSTYKVTTSSYFADNKVSSGPRHMCLFRNKVSFYGEELLASPTKHQAGGPLLVGCPRLLIQYIRKYPPYWRPFFNSQPGESEDLKDPSVDRSIILRWVFRTWYVGVDWIDLAQDRDRWRTFENAAMNFQFP
jgi:hypothetical protein